MTVVQVEEPTEVLALVPHHDPEPEVTTLVPRSLGGLPYLADYIRLADAISRTEMVPVDLRGRPDAVCAVMMAGYELGVPPMQALQSINLIQGKPSASAELMRALITQAGHQFRLTETTNEKATVTYRRKEWAADQPWGVVTYDMDDARRAALVEWHEKWMKNSSGKNYKETWNPFGPDPKPSWCTDATRRTGDNYFKRPRAMLSARATSEAARLDFADVIAGLSYTPEEVAEFAPMPEGLSRPGQVSLASGSVAVVPAASAEDITAMAELAALVKAVEPPVEREALVGYLRDQFGPAGQMAPEHIPEATRIAAGWPETAPVSDAPAGPFPLEGETPVANALTGEMVAAGEPGFGASDECIHGLLPETCSICKHGLSPLHELKVSQCKSCEADIIWTVTEKGKSMPIDAEPTANGKFLLTGFDAEGKPGVRTVNPAVVTADDRYDSHFQTCPNADQHRSAR